MNAVEIVFLCIGSVIALFLICSFLYLKLGFLKIFYHNVLGWHQPKDDGKLTFNGCSFQCTCKYCGETITQDSQGNWF